MFGICQAQVLPSYIPYYPLILSLHFSSFMEKAYACARHCGLCFNLGPKMNVSHSQSIFGCQIGHAHFHWKQIWPVPCCGIWLHWPKQKKYHWFNTDCTLFKTSSPYMVGFGYYESWTAKFKAFVLFLLSIDLLPTPSHKVEWTNSTELKIHQSYLCV